MTVNQPKESKEVFYEYTFSFTLECGSEGRNKVLFSLADFLESKDWATHNIKAERD